MIWTDSIYTSTILPTTMMESSTHMLTKEYHEEVEDEVEKKRNKKNQLKTNHHLYDDDKRKKTLERNRKAALKCRQRKKQWLNDLQAKLEYLTNDNEHLQIQCNLMREELIQLRNILWSHKECSNQQNTTKQIYPLFQSNNTFYSNPYSLHLNNNNNNNNQSINDLSSSSSSSSPSTISLNTFQQQQLFNQ